MLSNTGSTESVVKYVVYHMPARGVATGRGYIGIYTPKISNRFVHVWDINTCLEIAVTSIPHKSNSWLRH